MHNEHHIHIRKRTNQKPKTYPNSDRKIRMLDSVCMGASLLLPAMALPQVYKVFMFQSAGDLSLFMWLSYIILTIPLIVYGFVHRVNLLIFMNLLWIVIDVLMVVGIVMYG